MELVTTLQKSDGLSQLGEEGDEKCQRIFSVCCSSIPTICVHESMWTREHPGGFCPTAPATSKDHCVNCCIENHSFPQGTKNAWQISIRIQSIWGITKQILDLVSKRSEMFNASNKEIYFEEKPQRQLLWLLHTSSSLLPHPLLFSGQGWGKNVKAKFRKVMLSYMTGNKTMWQIWVRVSCFCRIL